MQAEEANRRVYVDPATKLTGTRTLLDRSLEMLRKQSQRGNNQQAKGQSNI